MTFAVTTHLNFRGRAAALNFYKQVFGSEKTLMTYGAMGSRTSPHRPITSSGVRSSPMTASESWRSTFRPALAEGAAIRQPIGPSAWSPLYGMLTDRFGVTRIVDIDLRT